MSITRIEVTSERSTYRVAIGTGLLADVVRRPGQYGLEGQRLVITCPPVWRHQGTRLQGVLPPGDRPVLLPDGERAKTLDSAARLYAACVARRLDRGATIIAAGGGVVGDVGGFVAATYLRGVRLVQIPTTLLAQVDSAIGGKVGVNLPTGKNLVGAFHPPALVLCDTDVLATLPPRQFRAGMFEVVKYGVIASRPLFSRIDRKLGAILSQHPAVLPGIVADCCRIKAHVVTIDEREAGPRRALNFGHTIGHALEALTGYRRFLHGEAIGHGMLAAARLSVMRGAMTPDDEAALGGLLDRLGRRPRVSDLRASEALDVIARDKKVVAGRLHFVLARGIGATEVVHDVTTEELLVAMRALGMRD